MIELQFIGHGRRFLLQCAQMKTHVLDRFQSSGQFHDLANKYLIKNTHKQLQMGPELQVLGLS